MAELEEHDAVLDGPTRRLLSSPVIVPLVDASSLPTEPGGFAALPMAHYDQTLTRTLRVLHRFVSSESKWRGRRVFPRFVVTKFDRLSLEMLRKLDAPNGPPSTWELNDRQGFGQRLLAQYLPETARFLSEPHKGSAKIEPVLWYFSGLGTELRNGGELRIRRRLRPPLGGWEPDYPFEEYRTLLEEFGRLAHRLPREASE